jgi:hypothetical protein
MKPEPASSPPRSPHGDTASVAEYAKPTGLMLSAMGAASGIGFLAAVALDSELAGILIGACFLFGGTLLVGRRIQVQRVGSEEERQAHQKRLPFSLAGATIMLISPVGGLTDAVPPLVRPVLLIVGFGIFLLGRRLHPVGQNRS